MDNHTEGQSQKCKSQGIPELDPVLFSHFVKGDGGGWRAVRKVLFRFYL